MDTANLFVGSPETVTKRVLEFYDQVGGFGTLMFHAGRPYATPAKLARSMELFMREVAPEAAPPRSRRAGAPRRGGVKAQ